jgi:hypothetical protein
MRGFLEDREDQVVALECDYDDVEAPIIAEIARRIWEGPLNNPELAAAKKQGCAGCRWWTARLASEAFGDCHHTANHSQNHMRPDWWCSEWSGGPTPVDDQP